MSSTKIYIGEVKQAEFSFISSNSSCNIISQRNKGPKGNMSRRSRICGAKRPCLYFKDKTNICLQQHIIMSPTINCPGRRSKPKFP